MIRVLVTGGAGYIGSTLVPLLLDGGYAVTAVDNFMYGQDSLAAVCYHPAFALVRGDVRSPEVMRPLVTQADVIIPLAALVGAPLCDRDPMAATTTNKDAIVDMLGWLSREQRVLLPITNSGYGVGEKVLHRRSRCDRSPLRTTKWPKQVLERENSISFRLATVSVCRPDAPRSLVNDFVYRAVNDRFIVLFESHFKRNYIHVRDVARALSPRHRTIRRDERRTVQRRLSDANLSKRELCERIQAHLPSFVFIESAIGQDPDKRDYIVSNQKVERAGYRTAHSLDDGIRELIKGFAMIRNTKYSNV